MNFIIEIVRDTKVVKNEVATAKTFTAAVFEANSKGLAADIARGMVALWLEKDTFPNAARCDFKLRQLSDSYFLEDMKFKRVLD